MIKVNCNNCNKEIEIPLKKYNLYIKQGTNFYCDNTCRKKFIAENSKMLNRVFGKLKVIEKDLKTSKDKTRIYWRCKCVCGNEKSIREDALKNGATTSCGECSYNKFVFIEDYVIGYTTTDKEFFFDLGDYDRVSKHTWRESSDRFIATINKKTVFLHSFIMGDYTNDVVDHKDNNPSNNRKDNLRFSSYTENSSNQVKSKSNTSSITGVWLRKDRNYWVAELGYKRKTVLKESCNSFEEAVLKRIKAEFKYFKEYRNSKNDIYINEVLNKIGYSIERIISENKMEVIDENNEE